MNDDQRNGITIHYDGETEFVELHEHYAEALYRCTNHTHLVPKIPSDEQDVQRREKRLEDISKPGELIARIQGLSKSDLKYVAMLVDLIEWDKGNHLSGANWVLTYIEDLLRDTAGRGPSAVNSDPPFEAIGALAGALDEHWGWIEDGIEIFKKYPAILLTESAPPPTPLKPLLLAASTQADPATTPKRVAKPESSGKRTKKAAA